MALTINTNLGLPSINALGSYVPNGNIPLKPSFEPDKEQKKEQKTSLLELAFKGLIKKVILAIISMSLISKILPKALASNIFIKLTSGFLGYAALGTAFVQFEEWLEEKINKLFGNANVFSDLAAKTASISFLTSIGIAKKWYLIHESFEDANYNKALSLITHIAKPFETLAKKLNLKINKFNSKDSQNALNTFHNLGEWFNDFGLAAAQKKVLFLPTFSKMLGKTIKNIVGWPNWRKAILTNTKPQFSRDIFYKVAFLVPTGVLLEFIISHLHKEAQKEINNDE